MKKRGLKVCSILMLTMAIVLVTATGITSFAGYDGKLIGNFNGDDGTLQLAVVDVPEEAVEYANGVVGVLLADVYGNENGFDVAINDYTDVYLGDAYTVMSRADEPVYSFPLIEGEDIKMILNVFQVEGEWSASLGKNYAEELNELKSDKDETFMLYVEDGNIMAESENGKVLLENANYDYDETKEADFESDITYDEIVKDVEGRTKREIKSHKVTEELVEPEVIQEQMCEYSSDFYSDYEEFFNNWFSRWWRRWRPYSPSDDRDDKVEPVVPSDDGGDDCQPSDDGNVPVVPSDDGGDDYQPSDDGNVPVVPSDDGGDDYQPNDDENVPVVPSDDGGDDYQPNDDENGPYIPSDDGEDDKNQPSQTIAPSPTVAPTDDNSDDEQPSAGSGIGAYAANPFSVNTDTAKTLNTDGCAVLQQDKQGIERGLCWAASTATMVNYMSGKKQLEAYNVADKMNIGYDNGGTLNDIKQALSYYGYSYRTSESQLSMDSVSSYIGNKKPVCMCAYASAGGHAVTIVGYSNESNNQTVTIWNSGNHQMQTCTYKSSGTSFSYGGYKFTWYATVYPSN